LFCDRQDRGISDGDGIERAEVVDDAEGTSIPFYDAKPSGTVSGVGRSIHCGVSGSCEKTLIERNIKIVASQRGQNLLCGLSKSGNKLVVICN
jgi:hypothetical protein